MRNNKSLGFLRISGVLLLLAALLFSSQFPLNAPFSIQKHLLRTNPISNRQHIVYQKVLMSYLITFTFFVGLSSQQPTAPATRKQWHSLAFSVIFLSVPAF
jgi:hypothetical protein